MSDEDKRMAREITYLDAIREALREEMRRDPQVFVLGEDVGAYGGAFGITKGLQEEFGEYRCLDMPISESCIIGVSVGASLRGFRPVAEMQFGDSSRAASTRSSTRPRRCGTGTAAAWPARSSSARRSAGTWREACTTRRIPSRGSCTGPG